MSHFKSSHTDLLQQIEDQSKYINSKREEMQKKRKQFSSFGSNLKQLKLTPSASKDLSLDVKPDPNFQKEWNQAVTRFLAETNSPYSLVGGQPFHDLINVLLKRGRYGRVPPLKLKDRWGIKRDSTSDARDLRCNMSRIVKHFLPSMISVGLTSDIWSSKSYEQFISLTLQFLTEQFEMIRLVPNVSHFPQRHTGLNIKLKVEKMLEAYGLLGSDVKIYVCHDNAANCKLAFRIFPGAIQMFCINHTLQLSICDSLKGQVCGTNVADLLKKCKDLAKSVRKSPLMVTELKSVCTEIEINYVSLKPVQKIRWNSTATNTKSVIHLKPALVELSVKNGVSENWGSYEFTNQEWRLLGGINKILMKLLVITKTFESDEPTIHLVIPKLFEIRKFLENFEHDPSNDR